MTRFPRGRQAVIQAYKRSRIDPPWLLAASARPNAKALALALSGYTHPAAAVLPGASSTRDGLAARILELRLPVDTAAGAWGYGFSVQTRHLFYSDRVPNAIATCFVVEALMDAFETLGERPFAETALGAKPFLVSLFRARGGSAYFAYVRAGSELIHNANLLVCAALTRLEAAERDEHSRELVAKAVPTTLAAQRSDGLWPYGDAPNLGWADNFHTAYVLESLCRIADAHEIGGDELEHGLEAWIERFFEPDGAARYFPGRRYPLEPHSYASAIDLLLTAAARDEGRRAELQRLAERIAHSAIRELWLEDEGRFAFRRGRRSLNRREFMRWTNAPMFRALARLCSIHSEPT